MTGRPEWSRTFPADPDWDVMVTAARSRVAARVGTGVGFRGRFKPALLDAGSGLGPVEQRPSPNRRAGTRAPGDSPGERDPETASALFYINVAPRVSRGFPPSLVP
jgi:hypothetical protein